MFSVHQEYMVYYTRFPFVMWLTWNPGGVASWQGGASSSCVPIYSEYCCILYGRMRFDDVCLTLKLWVEMWSWLHVSPGEHCTHIRTQKSIVAATKATVWRRPVLLYCCCTGYRCCCCSMFRGCAVVFWNPEEVRVYVVLPPGKHPINCTSLDYAFVPNF